MIGQNNNFIDQLKTNVDISYVFGYNNAYTNNKKYPNTREGKDKIIAELEDINDRIVSGKANTSSDAGKINASSTIEDLTTAGVVSKNNKTGFHTINPNDFDAMNVNDQAELGLKFNANLAKQTWFTDNDNHKYLVDPKGLVSITGLNNTKSHSKMKSSPAIQNFIKNTDNLIGAITSGNTPANMNSTDLTMFQGITSKDKIFLTSVLRSLQDNTRAYRNRLEELTVSQHMRGNSVDIRTEPTYKRDKRGRLILDDNNQPIIVNDPSRHYKVGKALWEFFKTPSGKSFLLDNKMNALYHNAGTGLHIDVSIATKRRPAGGVTDKS